MKILWLVNIVMPELAVHLGREATVFGGWLDGAKRALCRSDNQLVICTTQPNGESAGCYDLSGVRYYITESSSIPNMQRAFSDILEKEKPDIVHIYGTEFEHAYAMASVSEVERTLVTIQGSLIICKDLAFASMPEKICKDNIYHKLLRKLKKGGQSIELQKQSFEKRAAYEEKILKRVKYINGGSRWGNSVARSVNPDCHTLDCNLILRESFYDGEMWSYDECDKHSIYVLFSYPIKGFHKFLEALAIIKTQYPDVKVNVVADTLYYRSYTGLKRKIMELAPDYQWYVQELVEKYGLRDNLNFLGYLNESQVKEKLLKSNAFVSASAIENQSTALGEAMMLGVPCVASCVGAIQEMIDDGTDGFIYPFNEPHLLADSICRIFADEKLAAEFSVKGSEHSKNTYDREKNSEKLIDMYKAIIRNLAED